MVGSGKRPMPRWAGLVGPLVALALVSSCSSPRAISARSTTTTTIRLSSCTARQLAVSGGRQGTSETAFGFGEVTNTSAADCFVQGPPTAVSFVTVQGTTLSIVYAAAPGTASEPAVSLAPGEAADFEVTWSNWCGADPGPLRIRMALANAGGSVQGPFNSPNAAVPLGPGYVPVCIFPGQPSTMVFQGYWKPSAVPQAGSSSCQPTRLHARVTSGGAEASQPFVIIAVTNGGPPCQIDGYPWIVSALGHETTPTKGKNKALFVNLTDGSDYERIDPGPHSITLRTRAAASFALGTNTASGAVYVITSLSIALPGSIAPVAVADVDIACSGPTVPISVTAFVQGAEGPPNA